MRIMILLLCAALAGCTTSVTQAPCTRVAECSTADERAALAVESAYAAARTLLEAAVDSGVVAGRDAERAAALDRRAFAAVEKVRAAYRGGQAIDLATRRTAILTASAAIADLLAAARHQETKP